MLGGLRARYRDEHERRSDPVVEAALDVEQPPDPGRNRRVDHHARAQRGVGGRQGGADQQGEPDAHAVEQGQCEQRAQADRQRQPDPEQPGVQARIRLQLPQPHPGRIGEQHQHQRRLCQALDQLRCRGDAQHRQRPAGQQQAGQDEDDRCGHIEPLQPGRHGSPREHQRGHDRQIRLAHRLTRRIPSSPPQVNLRLVWFTRAE
jgi:hypothetical protein